MALGQRVVKAAKDAAKGVVAGDPFYAFAGMTPEARAIYEQQIRIGERKKRENEDGRKKDNGEGRREKINGTSA